MFLGPFLPHGFLFLVGKLAVAVLVELLQHFRFTGFLTGLHFLHALGGFRIILGPFLPHGFSFLCGELAVAILVKFLQDGGFLGFLGLLQIGLQNGYFLIGELPVLVGVILGHDKFFPDDHHAGVDLSELKFPLVGAGTLAAGAVAPVARALPHFRGRLAVRSSGHIRCGRGRILGECRTCGEGRS